ncbi:MAG: cytochrome b [Gammaproteobacteria bacterium]|nr:cytochrome b [Gammaproteobacteria bacterium]
MNFKNSSKRYGFVSRALHWIAALSMLVLIPLGWYFTQLSNESVQYWRLLEVHETLGFLVFSAFCINLLWGVANKKPPLPISIVMWERVLASVVHGIFKLTMCVLPLTGYVYVASEGDPIELYDLIVLPELPEISKSVSDLLFDIHFYGAYFCAGLIGLHLLAVLKHQFIDKIPILKRML